MLAWGLVAVVDVSGGFNPDGYRASVGEWLGYGCGSLLIVGSCSGLWSEIAQLILKPTPPQIENTDPIKLQDIENAPWKEIERWLQSDAPEQYDFLNNKSVADRVSRLISSGTRSIGIVGPFGAGKTSLIQWVVENLAEGRTHVAGTSFASLAAGASKRLHRLFTTCSVRQFRN